jgi:iron(III) transport system ATP-binding protein
MRRGRCASTRKAVAQLLGAAGITTILVTHDQAEALSFADQVAVMRGGLLVQAGRPLDLYLRPRDAAVAGFLGDSIVLPAQVGGGWADCALGRIAVSDSSRQGAAQIMLRPEQLQVAEVPAEAAAQGSQNGDCYGAVVDTDFGGPVSVLSVRLVRGTGAAAASMPPADWDEPLLVHSAGMHAPAQGAMVRITVAGQAHVFSA